MAMYLKTCFCASSKQRIGKASNLEMFSSLSSRDEEFDLPAMDARYLVTVQLLVNIEEEKQRGVTYDKSIT